MPFWFWNGKMEGSKIAAEIDEMGSQHVYGAFLHARDGLQTPYLSEEWWQAIGAGLEESKRTGFEFNFVDEYDWPGGEVRNIWRQGSQQSEVLAIHPEYRMKTLAYKVETITGPQAVDLHLAANLQAVVAARWTGENTIDDSTLTLLTPANPAQPFHWQAPAGKWVVVQFYLEPARGFDGGFVDLLNPDAMKLYFRLTYAEYFRRFGSFFGNTIHYSFSDHEGDYGYRIAWTPALFAAFQKSSGYDLKKCLPLLIYDSGNLAPKVRMDYLSTITALYKASFWDGITKAAAEKGIGRTGHAWEESLQWAAALQGSLFDVERGLNPVGVDSLFDYGRQSLNFKLTQSVADFEGRRYMCENQGVQGTDSYLDMEAMRRGTNPIAAWGVNLFVPHAFNYDVSRANYPPDWLHQPFWQYFHYYADYTRRLSYMNADSQHVTNVLLYYPITSMWEYTRPLFSGEADYGRIGQPAAWHNETILLNDYYTRLTLQLTEHQWDYNLADDQYLAQARIEGSELVIGSQHFSAIVLPPLTALSRATLDKLQQFRRAGGSIYAIRLLPTASPQAGANDPVLKSGIAALFANGDSPKGPGAAYFVSDSVDDLIALLDRHNPKDVQIVSGPDAHVYFEHRRKADQDYYWVVNDTDRPRLDTVLFSQKGTAEKWNALTGAREPLFYVNRDSGTEVRLNFSPWDAYYVVFHPDTEHLQHAELVATNVEQVDSVAPSGSSFQVHVAGPVTAEPSHISLRSAGMTYTAEISSQGQRPVTLDGPWLFRPQPDSISVDYAKVKDAAPNEGEQRQWESADLDDADWPSLWLSEEQNTVRTWNLIGPFSNPNNSRYAEANAIEQEFSPDKKYPGLNGRMLSWTSFDGDEPRLVLGKWNIWMESEGGEFSDTAHIVEFDPALLTEGDQWVTSYAHTYLYSPQAVKAQFVIAADNWLRLWLNGKPAFGRLRTPFWYELNDNWADRVPVDLHAGWNEVLLEVGKAGGVASGHYGFTFRVADENGRTLREVTAALSPKDRNGASPQTAQMRWYRLAIPPGCTAIKPPHLHGAYRMSVNGHAIQAAGNAPISIESLLRDKVNTLVIQAAKGDRLDSPVEFVTGETQFALTPWTKTGLANFSGTAIYTKAFSVPESYAGKRVMLDLGRVSSVADVYVNQEHAGTLIWRPYQLDITKLIKPGANVLKILVTNTEANARAVGASRHILNAIDLCGLEGPVQLVPYFDETITLHSGAAGTSPTAEARGIR